MANRLHSQFFKYLYVSNSALIESKKKKKNALPQENNLEIQKFSFHYRSVQSANSSEKHYFYISIIFFLMPPLWFT